MPRRDKTNQIDMTYLSLDTAANRVFFHRDYLAHVFRYSHVMKILSPSRPTRILEAGCGIEAPLAKALYSNRFTMHKVMMVDYGPIEPGIEFKSDKFQPIFIPNRDFSTITPEEVEGALGGPAELVISFEVMEHMAPDRVVRCLKTMQRVSSPDALFLISTPCYDHRVGAADNHLNEMTHDAFGAILEQAGFAIVTEYGTFASQRDYKDAIEKKFGEGGLKLWEITHGYWDSNLLANFWAVAFPEHSRNVLWTLRKRDSSYVPKYDTNILTNTDPAIRGQYEDEAVWLEARRLLGLEPAEASQA